MKRRRSVRRRRIGGGRKTKKRWWQRKRSRIGPEPNPEKIRSLEEALLAVPQVSRDAFENAPVPWAADLSDAEPQPQPQPQPQPTRPLQESPTLVEVLRLKRDAEKEVLRDEIEGQKRTLTQQTELKEGKWPIPNEEITRIEDHILELEKRLQRLNDMHM